MSNWQEDEAFVQALERRGHVERTEDGRFELYLADRIYFFMYEAWTDARALAAPAPEEDDTAPVERLVPTDAIIEKARRLQALALDTAAAPGERDNAWRQFEKLWKRYEFPVNFGVR